MDIETALTLLYGEQWERREDGYYVPRDGHAKLVRVTDEQAEIESAESIQ